MADVTVEKLKETVDRVYNSDTYVRRRSKWRRFLKRYMNEFWDDAAIAPADSRVSYNLIFSTVEANTPLLTDNKPIWTVMSRWPHQQSIADNLTKASRAIWDILDMDKRLFDAVKDSQLFGTGIFKVYFDPIADDIRVEVIDPSTFVIAPGYEDPWEAPWCGQILRKPLSWAKSAYPDKAKELESSEATNGADETLWDRQDIELEEDFVTVYEIWMRDDSTVEEVMTDDETGEEEKVTKAAYPNGRIITFTDDEIVLDDIPSQFEHGKPPYIPLYDYTVPHQFWGQGEPDQIEALVLEINVRLQQLVELVRKYSKKNFIISDQMGIKADKFKEMLIAGDEVLVAKGDVHRDMVIEVNSEQVNTSLPKIIELLKDMVEEVSGVTDITKGQIGKKSRQSASEVSILVESSYTRTRQRVRNTEWSLRRLLTVFIHLMQQYYTEPRPFSSRQDEGVQYGYISNDPSFVLEQNKPKTPDVPVEKLHPEDQQAVQDYQKLVEDFAIKDTVYIDFEIQIDTNSTLPLDKQSQANLAVRLAEMKTLPPEALLEILRIPNAARYIRMLKEKEEKAMQMKQQQASAPGATPVKQGMMQPQGGR